MKIEQNKFVTLSYELRTDSADGALVEKTDEATPLRFLYGSGRMLEMFEKEIEGLEQGASFKFMIPCAEAYGELNKDAIVDLPKNIFVVNGEIKEDLLVVGNHIPMMGAGGQRLDGIVLEVADDHVKMDFNHPMAGEDLYFSGNVIEVRDATEEEIVEACTPHEGCGGGCGSCGGGCGDHDCDCDCDDHGHDHDCNCGHCH